MNDYSGVKEYRKGVANVQVFFPVDFKGVEHINCYQCRFFQRTSGRCALTHEVTEFPEKFIGGSCPLKIEEVEHG